MKYSIKCIFIALLVLSIVSGCKDDDNFEMNLDLDKEVKIVDFAVDDALDIVVDEKRKTIVITYPGGTDVSSITPTISVSEGAVLQPASGTSIDLKSPKLYTVLNGNLFSRYRVSANVLSVTAFLSHHSSVNDIKDDDEKAYAEWFFQSFDEQLTDFVSFQDIKDGNVDLSTYRSITWYLDGDENEGLTMPAIALDPEVLSAISNYYKEGGNLYLLGYAGRYLIETGRLPANKYFMEVGSGQGFDNPDPWGVGTAILGKDQSGHPIFSDISLTVSGSRKTFPVIGPGWKENHNYVIVKIPEVYGLPNDSPEAYDKFNEENSTKWLGVWDGIGDFFMAGIIEFLPTNEFKGRAIFQGIGGIEWNQNAKGDINPSGVNQYQQNIEKLSFNAINYLILN